MAPFSDTTINAVVDTTCFILQSFCNMYIRRLLLYSTATWMIGATTETNGAVDCLLQGTASPAATIYVCQNKFCCQRWKLKTSMPDVLHDILSGSEIGSNSNRILIEKSSCLGQCDKGPNLRIGSASTGNEDLYANGISDVIGLTTELDETLSITIPSKVLAAVNVFEKAQTGKFPCDECLFCCLISRCCTVSASQNMAPFYRVANN